MKVLLLLATVIAVASSASLSPGHIRIIKNGLQRELSRYLKGVGPDGILPPLDPSIKLNDTTINFSELEQEFADGIISIIDGVVEGLHTLSDELVFNALALTLAGDVKVETAAIAAKVEADAIIHLPISGEDRTLKASTGATFSGNVLTFSITGLYAKIHVNLITDRGSISDLDANVHFDGPINLQGEGIYWAELLVDWAAVNADLPAFIADLIENQRPEVLRIATVIINLILADISISDLIDLIG